MKYTIYSRLSSLTKYLLLTAILGGCASISIDYFELDKLFGKVDPPNRAVHQDSDLGQAYLNDIQPLIDKRCVVCHGCYDAPCQLKLSSAAGIERGANKDRVYNGTRILNSEPTRLGIDASSVDEWRTKGFFNVLNDRNQTDNINLERSLIYQFLQLKKQHPLPEGRILNDDFSLGLNREQQCASIDEFDSASKNEPLWGMPYGLPGLTDREHNRLAEWLKKGSPMVAQQMPPKEISEQIKHWEIFFNQSSLKHQLSSRYIYEHLFLANIYFSRLPLFTTQPQTEKPKYYFKLVRSSTPAPQAIDIIATRRPYDDPKVKRIYYRLQIVNESIVSKSHLPYAFNQQRLEWMKKLFITPDYHVKKLPSYDADIAVNPLAVFKDIPMNSRYRFMLEEAEFTIMGFIKGPVCRGQVALNVIDDHFWVAFIDPEKQSSSNYNQFLSEHRDNLRLPGEEKVNSAIIKSWSKLSKSHSQYLSDKSTFINQSFAKPKESPLDYIWDGDQKNPNAALTIFRHFDSSTVVKGFVGQNPKTAWIIDYPLLERIHYLLVAEFDVYGNVGHQLITRLYMDFLRIEGEFNFLALLPQDERLKLADYWYRDTNSRIKQHLIDYETQVVHEAKIPYRTVRPKIELFGMLKEKLDPVITHKYDIYNASIPFEHSALLARINRIQGERANIVPELSLITLVNNLGQQQVFTLIRNTGHSNISSLLLENINLLPKEDYLTIVPGIIGSYPSVLFRVHEFRLQQFVEQISTLENEDDYANLLDQFGIRRNNKNFWKHSDELHTWFNNKEPLQSGLLDYNRLENR
ncbi:MAG: fatty acid cis/trans isomerase [Oleispira antarctica]|uniref:Fatty acid cis/trans isomerase n=1 Tax=Oleispira antarctica RB-8 TaxID=698738 RepID=R4YLP8_OLEAN|nr:fatty acid cis/trans isomerase [Oleispira antarctica]MBQ0792888.1 fatty acid cis/trans isomerase [Oleispira antarctica]CCK75465.1 Fatty acid cis/trans isomerase [Oleispira antarctica RB-8]